MKRTDSMDITAIQAELDALPTTNKGTTRTFTPEQDDALRYARARTTPWADLSSWWKSRYGWGCTSTLQRRWNEIK